MRGVGWEQHGHGGLGTLTEGGAQILGRERHVRVTQETRLDSLTPCLGGEHLSSLRWHVKEEGTVGPAARVCKQFTDLLGGGPTDGRATRPKVDGCLVAARSGEVEFKATL